MPLHRTTAATAAALALAACTSCASPPAQNPAQPASPTILFAQDSVGYGQNASDIDLSFRPLVVAGLNRRAPISEVTFGEPGFTVNDTATLLTVPDNLEYAVIELGSNDANRNRTPDQFTSDYTALLTRITTEAPDARVVCVGTLGTFRNAAAFDALIDTACTAQHGTFVSIADITADPANLATPGAKVWGGQVARDGQHPNDAGHSLIAQKILDALTP